MKVQLVDIQIRECEGFLCRARAHMAELDAKRTTVSANIQDAEKRLEALKEVQKFAPPPPVDAETELRQLREKVAQLQEQLEGVKPALAEGSASKRTCRREDFVPNCVEELQKWIGGRQADLHEAMLSGRHDEVARISNIMGHAAQQWQREVDGDEHYELRSTY